MGLFSGIARLNQMDILKKMSFEDFVKFKQCSRETVEIAENLKYRLPLKMGDITFSETFLMPLIEPFTFYQLHRFQVEPVRFEVSSILIASIQMRGVLLEDFFKDVHIQVESLHVRSDIDPLTISDFLKRFNVKRLSISSYPSFDLINLSQMQKLEEIEIFESPVVESTFLQFNATKTTINRSTLTLSSFNLFLKQWVDGKRRIEALRIFPFPEDELEMLNGLGASVHHAPEMRELKLNFFYKFKSIYSLKNKNGKILFIAIECNRTGYYNNDNLMKASEHESDDYESWIRLNFPSCQL